MSPGPSRRVSTAALIFVTASASQKGIGLLVVPVLARQLAPDEFGLAMLLLSISAAASAVLSMGLESAAFNAALDRRSDGDPRPLRAVVQLLVLLPLPLAGILALAVLTSSVPNSGLVSLSLVVSAVSVSALTAPLAVVRADQEVWKYARWVVGFSITGAVCKILFTGPLDLGVLGWVLGDLVAVTVMCFATFRRQLPHLTARTSLVAVRGALLFGLPLVPHQVSHWALTLGDRLVIAHSLGVPAVGAYAAAYSVGLMAYMIATEINRALMPVYRRGDATEGAASRQVVIHTSGAIAISAAIGAVSQPLVRALYPGTLNDAAALAPLICFGAVMLSVYFIPTNHLVLIARRTRQFWWVTAVAAGLNICLNVVLLPRIGLVAAGGATVVGYATIFLLMLVIVRREPGWHVVRSQVKAVARRSWPAPLVAGGVVMIQQTNDLGVTASWAFAVPGALICVLLVYYPAWRSQVVPPSEGASPS